MPTEIELDAAAATPGSGAPPASARHWLGRAGFAIADQFVQSGSNFGLSILLARTLPESGYGLFAVCFSVFLLIATLYQGAVLVPCTLLAATQYASRQHEFFRVLLRLHGWFSLVCVLCLAIGSVLIDGAWLGPSVAAPGVLLLWLTRTFCYANYRSGLALVGSILYAVVLFGSVFALAAADALSVLEAFIAMGAAGLAAGGLLWFTCLPPRQGEPIPQGEVLREGWKIGRWETAVAAVTWMPANLCYPMTASVLSAASAGQLRAVQNFSLPLAQGLSSLLRLAQPYCSSRMERNRRESVRQVWALAALAAAAAGVYLLAVWLLRRPLLALLYGGRFADVTPLLLWTLVSSVLAAGSESLAVGLRALHASRLLLMSLALSAVIFTTGVVPAAKRWGVHGVVGMLVASGAATLLASGFFLRRLSATGETA